MSEPMHAKKRFFIFIVFITVFVFFIQIVVLYSTGYRLGKGFSLLPTGGIYVFYGESGAKVFMDGNLSSETTLFERGIFIDNLKPQSYKIEVTKDGYRPWKKNIDVKAKKVGEAYPYLVPEVISTSSVQKFVTLSSGGSMTNSLYSRVVALFASSTAPTISLSKKIIQSSTSTSIVSTSTALLRRDISIDIQGDDVIASWEGDKDSTPFYFCDAERLSCVSKFSVIKGEIKHVDFYPGRNDVVIFSKKDGIYATELDTRPPQNTVKLLSGNLDFKEMDQRVFIKDKNTYYELLFTASTTANSISI